MPRAEGPFPMELLYILAGLAFSFMIGWEACAVFNSRRIYAQAMKLAKQIVEEVAKASSTNDIKEQ